MQTAKETMIDIIPTTIPGKLTVNPGPEEDQKSIKIPSIHNRKETVKIVAARSVHNISSWYETFFLPSLPFRRFTIYEVRKNINYVPFLGMEAALATRDGFRDVILNLFFASDVLECIGFKYNFSTKTVVFEHAWTECEVDEKYGATVTPDQYIISKPIPGVTREDFSVWIHRGDFSMKVPAVNVFIVVDGEKTLFEGEVLLIDLIHAVLMEYLKSMDFACGPLDAKIRWDGDDLVIDTRDHYMLGDTS